MSEVISMKDQLLGTVGQLRKDDVDLEKTPALFKWSYSEEPHIQFQLLILETDQAELALEDTLQ